MILQYKGYNNNWAYEEADIITSAVVYVGEIAEKYRNRKNEYKDEIQYADEVYKAVSEFIMKETNCENEIAYHIDNRLDQLGNVVVIMLSDKNKNITRVFEKGVYMLNSKGQTVQRLA